MSYFQRSYEAASNRYVVIAQERQNIISTAHFAFGGGISKGLLHRGQKAVEIRHDAYMKMGQRKLMLAIYNLPKIHTTGFWKEVDAIISQCHLNTWPIDTFDYFNAERSNYCISKLEALRNFINIHGNKIDKRTLLPKLEL